MPQIMGGEIRGEDYKTDIVSQMGVSPMQDLLSFLKDDLSKARLCA